MPADKHDRKPASQAGELLLERLQLAQLIARQSRLGPVAQVALESGAEDFKADDADVFEIITDPASFEAVKSAVETKNIPIQAAEIQMVPQNTIDVGDKSPALLKLLEMIEDNEDVQKVWSNGDIDEKYLAE